tara:strand:+ start:700 stop:876 length:177 start_codon:yes stop_codon:yes gene_type:complete
MKQIRTYLVNQRALSAARMESLQGDETMNLVDYQFMLSCFIVQDKMLQEFDKAHPKKK